MSCKRIELLLPAAVDRRLESGPQREVDEHLANCSACVTELDALQLVRTTLAACGPAEPPADLADRISQYVRNAVQQEQAPSFWERFIPVAWPAAIAATVAAGLLLTLSLRAPSDATGPSSASTTAPSADPMEQVSRADAEKTADDGQLAINVLGMGGN